ncbi:Gfo/Idh/MocA family oxidoreductase [Prochlorococcus sp. MIT 1307]|uniref:Gfo/Idh/MocA family protein n=1 Tax=Prochlorococcus sp. MIT 1307 TaxID=3096219 RepID=UPI002A756B07|nr:Gfo/Idh/MocA family oxidoreductase [Prochlorococcus sp. MIT 1307]
MAYTQINNNQKIGVSIVGLGFGESVHLPAIKANPKFELISLWHPNSDKLKETTDKHSLNYTKDWESLLNDSNVKGIILATPPEPRYNLACDALKAGKHLLLEKPVAINATQVADLQRLSLKYRLSVAIDFEYRAVPLFMQAKRLITKGLIGQPWLVKFDWLMSSRANHNRPWNWYSESNKGGGVLGALGTHAFDMIHWLFGPIEEISALSSTSIKERIDLNSGQNRNVTSEDIALAHIKIKGENNNLNIPAQITLSAVARQGRGCWIEFYGSKGTLILGSDNQKDYVHGFSLWYTKAGDSPKCIQPDKDLMFNKTWSDGRVAPVSRIHDWWAESIKDGSPMIPGLAEGFASQKVCDAFKESASSKESLII